MSRIERIGNGKRKRTAGRAALRAVREFALAGLTGLFVLFLTVVPVAGDSSDHGARRGKVAPDLKEMLKSGPQTDGVRLVIRVSRGHMGDVSEKIGLSGGRVGRQLRHVGQIIAVVPADSVGALTGIEGLEYIAPDRPVQGFSSHLQETSGSSKVYPGASSGDLLETLNDYGFGYDGYGITVAVIDSGIANDQFDLRDNGKKRTILRIDFVGSGAGLDPFGHGTHIAGIVAGDGGSYTDESGRDYAGIAPAANVVDMRVLDEQGRGHISDVITAIDFAIANRYAYGIRVLNLSLAAPPVESYRDDPLCQAVERATKSGLVVVTSAGNFGLDPQGNEVYGGIPSPAISPEAITVGASYTFGTDVRSDDVVAPFSSRGPTLSGSIDVETGELVRDFLAKPDLVAPGVRVVSIENPGNALVTAYPGLHIDTGGSSKGSYMALSGTSMSAGVVSGAAALMLQANPSLSPHQVKAVLMYTAQIMDGPDLFEQGAGMLNIDGALRLARSLSQNAGSLAPGEALAVDGIPKGKSRIAGENFWWSRGLVWNQGWVTGGALFETQQQAYSQSLIWGWGGYGSYTWSSGVSYYDGLYSQDHVVYGGNDDWHDVTWDSGQPLEGGAQFYDDIAASGDYWQAGEITGEFFAVDASSLIWGFYGYSWNMSLIWGYGGGLGYYSWGF